MKRMNVASCLNEAYVPYSYVMLKSLFLSNRSSAITVYLLHDGISAESKKNLFHLAKEYGQNIELILVTDFSMDPRVYEYGGWNELTMYRLLLWDILPPDVDRVLHLDGDMLIQKDLSDLYQMDFKGRDLVACPDILASGKRKDYCIKTHGDAFKSLFEEDRYFNAGMLLFNVQKNRGRDLLSLYEKTAEELDFILPYPDQDLLNFIHRDSILWADTFRYNFPPYDGRDSDGGFDEERIRDEVFILHFLDKKPWSEGDHRFYETERLWWETCKGSPYEKDLKKDTAVCVLALSEDEDPTVSLASAANVLREYFHHVRTVLVDACGIGKQVLSAFSDVEYLDVSDRDFETMAALKNDVAKQLSFDRILFVNAGEVLKEPRFFEVTEPAAVEKVLWEDGVAVFDRAMFDRVVFEDLGGPDDRLFSDEEYELALRSFVYGYGKNVLLWQEDGTDHGIFESTYDVYADTIGEFAGRLREQGIFGSVIGARLNEATNYGIGETFTLRLENALQRKDYQRPILILRDRSECQGALDSFALHFGKALRSRGEGVIFSDGDENIKHLRSLLLLPLKAVVGFQTKLYGTKLSSGDYLGSVIDAPKFHFLFDHPIYLTEEFSKEIPGVYVLSQDETYVRYVKKRLKTVADAFHFPPAGLQWDQKENKEYDITFVGTYNDYRLQEELMDTLPPNYRELSAHFYKRQRNEPERCAEDVLEDVLDDLGYELSDEEFVEALFAMGYAVKACMFYYREKVVESLLNGGIRLDVFSRTWEKAPFAGHENLLIHDEVSYEDGLCIAAKSRLTLNVMSWHKGGMTERLNNAMLNESVCVTDETTYIKREFPGEMLIFGLKDISELPARVRELLEDEPRRKEMAKRALQKAKAGQTWENRADEFLTILREKI